MTQDELRIPDPKTDCLLGYFPWGFGLSVLIVPTFISMDYRNLTLLAALLIMYGFFLNGMRRTMLRDYVCVQSSQITLCARGQCEVFARREISHVDWYHGAGVPMLSPISDPPRLRVTLMDGSTREVELLFTMLWREYRALKKLRKVLAPTIVRG